MWQPFCRYHKISLDDYVVPECGQYRTFNEFFYRKLKPGARPICEPDNPAVAVCAADARTNAFPTVRQAHMRAAVPGSACGFGGVTHAACLCGQIAAATELWIKGHGFTVKSLVDDAELAKLYDGGSLVIFRLVRVHGCAAVADRRRLCAKRGSNRRRRTTIASTSRWMQPLARCVTLTAST